MRSVRYRTTGDWLKRSGVLAGGQGLALAAFLAAACQSAACQGAPPPPAASDGQPDWRAFSNPANSASPRNPRAVPEVPQEVTGIPFIRSIRLAWSASSEVPTFEPDKETHQIPGRALQAVLELDLRTVPPDVDLEVRWHFDGMPGGPIFADALGSREGGKRAFALVMREEGRLVPLPRGSYRADICNGPVVLKSIPFVVG